MPLSICDACFTIQGVSCAETLELTTGLTATTDYFVWIKDIHNKNYIVPVTSDASGDIELTLPTERTFTSASGKFEITVSTSSDLNTAESITIDGQTYNCFIVTFADSVLIDVP